ncbi:hypothetical protein BB559_002168 [Furculomyces boomerangus]|uniref:Uncharacterized protein n=2 Tax=Harpellales TaxID=61421 RepID=A0A2T9YXB1_9FUNG|nr:hypothetical protein BB559_002168 [Furculomyces boomerangus]PWA00266.1 hypothetical protein BB558_003687 [Smittium angustum]
MAEFVLDNSPTDCISTLEFHPINPDLLLATSWDKKVRIYNVNSNTVQESEHHTGAVLAGCFSSTGQQVFSGGLDCKLVQWDLDKDSFELGSHDKPISCMDFNTNHNLITTGSWDKSTILWDYSSPNPLIEKLEQSERVYTLSTKENLLFLGLAGRQIVVYDLRNRATPLEVKQSMLKYPTRKIMVNPNLSGFVYSSIEGRVAVEYFGDNKAKYAFKCHRKSDKEAGVDTVYPVNALEFHPIYNTLATGGSDGMVSLWDSVNKKRLKQYGPYSSGVSTISFNRVGLLMAVGSSYTFDQGEKEGMKDEIYIRKLGETEAKPKSKKN